MAIAGSREWRFELGVMTNRKAAACGDTRLGQRGNGVMSRFALGGPCGAVILTSRVAPSSGRTMRAERQVVFTGGTIRARDAGEARRFLAEVFRQLEWLEQDDSR